MKLKGIQKDVDDWVGQHDPKYWPPYQNLSGLIEEVGEVAREISHIYREKKKKEGEKESSLEEELVDVIFSVVCMANSHNINLSNEWKKMFSSKLNGRDKDRFKKK